MFNWYYLYNLSNMLKKSLLFYLFLILIGCKHNIKSISSKNQNKLVWQDNFTGNHLDETKWNFDLGNGCPNNCGWGNNEKEYYTNKNYLVKDGFLTIIAKYKDSIYTSTRINTKHKFNFTYGRVEIRAKLPVGKGVWPAFWMLGSNIDKVGWPKCGEVDILEYVGKDPGMIYTSIHTPQSFGNTINTKVTYFKDVESGFHIYMAKWSKNKIEFFVDNTLVYTFIPKDKSPQVWPFNKSFYLLLNLAVGGNFGGPIIDNSIFPQSFVIDYIKVYKN